jgi:hypothetical protein
MTTNDFTFYSRADYFRELTRLVSELEPSERIAIATMALNVQDRLVNDLFEALSAAAKRGVTVHVVIDAYTFLSRERSPVPGPLWGRRDLPAHLPEPYNFQLDAVEKLRASGATCAITNMPDKPLSPPPTGRSHIKAAVVGDTVFVGGCNLESSSEIDVMVRWHDKDSASWLYPWIVKMAESSSTKKTFGREDRQFNIPNGPSLLIDAGVPKQSIIFENALQLIDSANKHIFITCQYFPGGTTGKHLRAAHKRGAEVQIIYNPPKAHGKKAFMHHLHNARERSRMPAEFFSYPLPVGAPYLHAKVLISETSAMVGSHNYISQGVTFGTAEIALIWKNAEFARALETFMFEHIRPVVSL